MWGIFIAFWNDGVWSKVIAAAIIAAAGVIWGAFSNESLWAKIAATVFIAAAGLLWSAIQFQRWSRPVTITHPENNKAISTEWVRVEGTHRRIANSKHHYWLMTTHGADWWPAEDIKLTVNGKWNSRINVGKNPGPRVSSAAVVRVTPAIHALLTHVRILRRKAKDYAGITMPQGSRGDWVVIAQVDVQISGEIRVGETS